MYTDDMTPLQKAEEDLEVLLDNGHDRGDIFVAEAKQKIIDLGGDPTEILRGLN